MDNEKNTNTPAQQPQVTQGSDGLYVARIRRIIPRVREGYILRQVGQAYMVMPTGPRMKDYEGMITLNETGAFLFKEAQKEDTSPEKLVQACIDEYGATEEEAKQAVHMFITQCADCGLFGHETALMEGLTADMLRALNLPVPERPTEEPAEAAGEEAKE